METNSGNKSVKPRVQFSPAVNTGPLAFDRILIEVRFMEILEVLERINAAGLSPRFRLTQGNIRLIYDHANGIRKSCLVDSVDDSHTENVSPK